MSSAADSGRLSDAVARVESDLLALWTTASGEPPKTRASVANVVLVTPASRRDAAVALASRLQSAELARSFVVALDPHRAPWDVTADVSAQCRQDSAGDVLCGERIELTFGSAAGARVGSLIHSLLVGGVPTFVVALERGAAPLVEAVTVTADWVIFDSETLGVPAARRLADLADGAAIDLAWRRVRPWRAALASCFDGPRGGAMLNAIDRVRIGVGGAGTEAAWLLLGWLGSRLGWSAAAEALVDRNGRRVSWSFELDGDEDQLLSVEVGAPDRRANARREGAAVVSLGPDGPARVRPLRDAGAPEALDDVLVRPVFDPIWRDALAFADVLAGQQSHPKRESSP